MPPLVFLAIVGAGAYAGYRYFNRMVEHAHAEMDKARKAAAAHQGGRETRDLGELEWDATAGVYRPKKSG